MRSTRRCGSASHPGSRLGRQPENGSHSRRHRASTRDWGAECAASPLHVDPFSTRSPRSPCDPCLAPEPAGSRGTWRRTWRHPRAVIVGPVDYGDFVRLLASATVIITDSGVIQEEALQLGYRSRHSYRDRTSKSGCRLSRVVGVDRHAIVAEVSRLLQDPVGRSFQRRIENPYGDGHAAERIADLLVRRATAARQRPTPGSILPEVCPASRDQLFELPADGAVLRAVVAFYVKRLV